MVARCAPGPETPELCDVLVIYPKLRQRYWEHVPIELWIGARPRHRTNVNNKLDFRPRAIFRRILQSNVSSVRC